MQTTTLYISRSRGFSLIEMAIVLFITALLLGGLLPTVSGQIEQQRRKETLKQLDEIQQALTGYAIINKRLPCPANKITPTIPSVSNGAGLPAGTPGACSSYTGVLPWVELGLSETDAWGRRFTYSVANTFTTASGFTLSTTSTLNILDTTGGVNVAAGVPAVVISHGTNGLGAYTPQGSQIPNTIAGTDEKTNSNGTPPFVSHDPRPDFDDHIVWLTPNILFNRLVAAGQLP